MFLSLTVEFTFSRCSLWEFCLLPMFLFGWISPSPGDFLLRLARLLPTSNSFVEFACIRLPSSYPYASSLMDHFNTSVLVSGMPEFVRMNLFPLFLILTESLFHECPLFIISCGSLQYKCSHEWNSRVRLYKFTLFMLLPNEHWWEIPKWRCFPQRIRWNGYHHYGILDETPQ